MGREMRGGPKGDICKPMPGFMLKLDKKQQNSVKQLSFNKKIKEKRYQFWRNNESIFNTELVQKMGGKKRKWSQEQMKQ